MHKLSCSDKSTYFGVKRQNVIEKIGNRLGFYTKQQCVDIATNVGKDLALISAQGEGLSKKTLQLAIRKYAPRVKVKHIITAKPDMHSLLTEAGYLSQEANRLTCTTRAATFRIGRFGKVFEGIYIPLLESLNDIPALAHEVEHYIYDNHTLKMKLMIKIGDAIELLRKNLNLRVNSDLTHIYAEKNIQSKLIELLGIDRLEQSQGCLENIESSQNGLLKLLTSKAFSGLKNEKRVDAYLRTILRSEINPKSRPNILQMIMLKNCLDDEARAYNVSDNVKRYVYRTDNNQADGIIKSVYERVSKILDKEIRIAIKNKILNKKKVKPTGMPTSAYVGYDPYEYIGNVLFGKYGIRYSELPDFVKEMLWNKW